MTTTAPDLRSTAVVSRDRLRVVVLDEELPYPPNSGKRIRTLNLVTRLARRHEITYICHRNQDEHEIQPAEEHFASCGIRTVVLDRTVPAKSGLGFYARLAANLLSHKPYSVQIHNSRELREALRRELSNGQVDLIQAEWTPYADCLQVQTSVPWVVMAHNIESLIWRRYHESEAHWARRWYIGRQWRKFEEFEKQVFAATARLITVSQPDAQLAGDQFGAGRVDVVDNGVDIEYFHPESIERDPQRILFLGSLDWRPNQDAVEVLLNQIFPQVLAAVPSAHLDIVGRNPPDWLIDRAASAKNLTIHASVPDVRPFLWRSGLMVVPLRIGGGSRLKILEALATVCPVVSTRVGAEGLDLVPERHFVEVASINDMPEALLHAMQHPDDLQQLAAAGREQVTRLYGWDRLADTLDRVWRDVAQLGTGTAH